ncbi:MAG: MBL fold metallo-hydrolase [Verrucomicrobiaceae bacterium]|nr:MBL fold metallo-hydrolase [Verrucomicrobiaceae bacterium]
MFPIQTYTGGIASTNSHLLQLPAGKILVDAPEGVADWLDEQDAYVETLLITHQHFDHVMDAAEVKARHGCRVIAWSPFSRDLTLERLFGAVTGSMMSVPAFEVDDVLAGQDSVSACGVDWRLYHVPGHSPDSVCFHWEEKHLLFGGDVLFWGSIGRTDFPGGSQAMLVSGIQEKLLPLPDDTLVYSGHGPRTSIGVERRDNPFIQ